MRKLSNIPLLIIFAGLVFVLTACSDPNDQFIQGKWADGNAHYWSEWNFESGTYSYEFDDTHASDYRFYIGEYIVLESGTDYIVLELINQQGGFTSIEDKDILRIDIDRDADKLKIRRTLFTRVFSSTLEELATQSAP
jgi:hypothetical protein